MGFGESQSQGFHSFSFLSLLYVQASASTFYAKTQFCWTFFSAKQAQHPFLIPQYGNSNGPRLQKQLCWGRKLPDDSENLFFYKMAASKGYFQYSINENLTSLNCCFLGQCVKHSQWLLLNTTPGTVLLIEDTKCRQLSTIHLLPRSNLQDVTWAGMEAASGTTSTECANETTPPLPNPGPLSSKWERSWEWMAASKLSKTGRDRQGRQSETPELVIQSKISCISLSQRLLPAWELVWPHNAKCELSDPVRFSTATKFKQVCYTITAWICDSPCRSQRPLLQVSDIYTLAFNSESALPSITSAVEQCHREVQ